MYERQIRQSLPGYEALHAMTNAFLANELASDAHLLIAGVGTGMELVTLGKLHPGWRFTAFDLSPEMLAVCRGNVAACGVTNRVTLVEGTVDKLPEHARFDAATSLLVSHFILSEAGRQHYFSTIAQKLKPHALLIAADLFGEKSQPYFALFTQAWRTFNIVNGRDPVEFDEGLNLSDRVVSYLPEEIYCGMLAKADFVEVQQFYRALHFGGWVGRRG